MAVESRITEITLYARGARIRRTAEIPSAESSRVRIVGLPVAVIDDTVRIEADGGLVTAVHVGLDAPANDAAAGEDAPEVRAARRRVALAEAEVERVDGALASLAAAPIAPAIDSDEPPPAWGAIVEARRALVTLRAERELALREQAAAARRELEEAQRELVAAVDRDRRAGSAREAKLHELRKYVELELAGSARSDDASGAEPGVRTVHVEYQVAAARWAPSYVARFEPRDAAGGAGTASVTFELRASIAQDTGEDWTGVALRLSTAEPERFGALPELAAQRIGRRQREPRHTGFRAPPAGASALYADYVHAFPSSDAALLIGVGRIAADSAVSTEDQDEISSHLEQVFGGPQRAQLLDAPKSAPAPAAGFAGLEPVRTLALKGRGRRTMLGAPMEADVESGMLLGGRGYGGPGAPAARSEPPRPPPPPPPRLDYANLRMAPPGSPLRGTLIAAAADPRAAALEAEVASHAARLDALALPSGCSTEWAHTYDYAYATDGAVDVRADGAWHSIAVTAKPAAAKLRHVAVPREQPDVFRIATIGNPLDGPLLPGPIDIYDRGSFLVTSSVDQTPPGAAVEIGLGVDAAVKLSRNTEFREEATGVLRGGLRLHHAIQIDVDNLSERAIELEVRERVPVAREGDDDVEVIVGRIDPAWERWTPDPEAPRERRLRGGYRWRLSVPARSKRALRAAYEVKIAGKLELVGGNRRES
jgi:hypothetical protein